MAKLLMLALSLLAGVLLRRGSRVADGAHGVLNAVISHRALPAVIWRQLHGFRLEAALLVPAPSAQRA